jgi:Mg2+ and Co2+ transporter CorA
MPTQDLDTLDGKQAWWQELGNRIDDAYKARSQDDEDQKDAAQKALEEFRDYSKLPDYEGLRQTAVDAIADFLLTDIEDALNGLSALEDEIRSGAQHELRMARFVAESFRPRQYLLRALTSLAALQAHYTSSQTDSKRNQRPASRKKLAQAVKLIGELLPQPPDSDR